MCLYMYQLPGQSLYSSAGQPYCKVLLFLSVSPVECSAHIDLLTEIYLFSVAHSFQTMFPPWDLTTVALCSARLYLSHWGPATPQGVWSHLLSA